MRTSSPATPPVARPPHNRSLVLTFYRFFTKKIWTLARIWQRLTVQAVDAVNAVKNGGTKIGMMWIDVEIYNWPSNQVVMMAIWGSPIILQLLLPFANSITIHATIAVEQPPVHSRYGQQVGCSRIQGENMKLTIKMSCLLKCKTFKLSFFRSESTRTITTGSRSWALTGMESASILSGGQTTTDMWVVLAWIFLIVVMFRPIWTTSRRSEDGASPPFTRQDFGYYIIYRGEKFSRLSYAFSPVRGGIKYDAWIRWILSWLQYTGDVKGPCSVGNFDQNYEAWMYITTNGV